MPLTADQSSPATRLTATASVADARELSFKPERPGSVEVLAVVVCHEPDHRELHGLVKQLGPAPGLRILLVDNSETNGGVAEVEKVARLHGLTVVRNGGNLGVAEAQNIGIRRAKELGCAHVLLLDQDSRLDAISVERMVLWFWQLRLLGHKVAAVGPLVIDPRNNSPMDFVRLGRLRMRRLPRTSEPISCDMLISSGCLIAMDAIDHIGAMDGRLFVDYVDMEWCVRARLAGYEVLGLPDVTMQHSVGESTVRVAGRPISVHTPLRAYYLVRNALLFARKKNLPMRWRVHLLYRAIGHLALFSTLLPERGRRIRWMVRGAWDGLLGRGGRVGGQVRGTNRAPAETSAATDTSHPERHQVSAVEKLTE